MSALDFANPEALESTPIGPVPEAQAPPAPDTTPPGREATTPTDSRAEPVPTSPTSSPAPVTVSPPPIEQEQETAIAQTGDRKVWQKGQAKLGLVGAVVLFGMYGVWGLTQSGSKTLSNSGTVAQSPLPSGSDGNTPNGDPNQVANLKTQVALGTQAQEIQKLNGSKSPSLPAVPPTTSVKQIPVKASVPDQGSYGPPAPVLNESPSRDYPVVPPYRNTYSPEPAQSYPPQAVGSIASAAVPLDGDGAGAASNFISYGRLPVRGSGRSQNLGEDSSSAENASYSGEGRSRRNGANFVAYRQSGGGLKAEQEAFLSDQYTMAFLPGVRVSGRIESPAIVQEGQEFLVKISKSFQSKLGTISEGSYATAQIDKVYDGGLLEASVKAIVTPSGQRYAIPGGTLRVMSAGDRPLIGKSLKEGGGFGSALGSIALSALSGAVNYYGQSQMPRYSQNYGGYDPFQNARNRNNLFSNVVPSNVDFGGNGYGGNDPYALSSSNYNPNLTGALLQGGISATLPMLRQQQETLQQQAQGQRNSSSVKFLKAGTKVQLQAM